MRTLIALLGCLLFALPAAAQEDTVEAVKRELQARGVLLSGACGSFQITNEVARHAHLQLLSKAEGNRASPQPNGSCLTPDQTDEPGYAVDYPVYPTGIGVDILRDAGSDNAPR